MAGVQKTVITTRTYPSHAHLQLRLCHQHRRHGSVGLICNEQMWCLWIVCKMAAWQPVVDDDGAICCKFIIFQRYWVLTKCSAARITFKLNFVHLTAVRHFHHEKKLANLVLVCDPFNLEVGVRLFLPPRKICTTHSCATISPWKETSKTGIMTLHL